MNPWAGPTSTAGRVGVAWCGTVARPAAPLRPGGPGKETHEHRRERRGRSTHPPGRAPRDPLQRIRHELRRPPVPGALASPRRPRPRLQHPGLLDAPGADAGEGPVRRPVHRRRPRPVLRVRRHLRGRHQDRRADPRERPVPARLRDGRGHRAPRLRRHRRHRLRAPLPVRPPPRHARPPHGRPRGLERGHRLPALRRPEHGPGRPDGARRALRARRRVPRRRLQAPRGLVGGRRRRLRQGVRRVRGPGQGPRHRPRGPVLHRARPRRHRAVRAAHPRDLPGRRLDARPRLRRQARRGRVHQLPHEGAGGRHREEDPPGPGGRRP